jgi:SAM-dependent methyltransferase
VTTPDRLLRLVYAFREAKTVLSASELGVFTVLAEGPADAQALQSRVGLHPRGARDLLDALVALGLLERDAEERYSNAAEAALYLVRGAPTYLGGLLDYVNAREYPDWRFLTRALQTGEPQVAGRQRDSYASLYPDPEALDTFARAMTAASLLVAKALAASFPWHAYATLVDVGAAEGCLPAQIALRHAHIEGGGFDLPALGPAFERYVRAQGLAGRLRFYAGNFLEDPLPTADVLVMGRVLHNWDLATKQRLLGKAYEALAPGGALIVYERFIDDERRARPAGLLASLNMLIMTAGGFDYSAADCIGWMRTAGFRDLRVAPLTDDHAMVVGVK